ncbi:MAG: hypothetical protein KDA96_26985 [Planctomycetaceae bacterium]|nr:hypothetical protein [Planctomycetaceae bacterium]
MNSLFRVMAVPLVLLVAQSVPPDAQQTFVLKQSDSMRWYRGNMHTHSLWSDGDDYPEMIAAWYRDHNYQFLVFTDHNIVHNRERWVAIETSQGGLPAFDKYVSKFGGDWVRTRVDGTVRQVRLRTFDETFEKLAVPHEFLLIQGEEITDAFHGRPIHLCATNTSELIPPAGGDSMVDVMQKNIDLARARRERTGEKTLVHLNHPNFHFSVTAEELTRVVGENFFEVYNGHPSVHNKGDQTHASTERMWDIVNTLRLKDLDLPLMYGVATDDGHSYHVSQPGVKAQPGRGWVVVLADRLAPDALVTALEAGRFYSSSGVRLEEIQFDGKTLRVKVSPDDDVTYRIDFIGTKKNVDTEGKPASDDPKQAEHMTRIYSEELGQVLESASGTEATYELTGEELYVRAVVTSSRPHPNPSEKGDFEQAWIQPVTP